MIPNDLYRAWQNRIISNSKYRGIPTLKAPTDFWIFQEIISEYEPTIIIEIGNYFGGMLLAYHHWMNEYSGGQIYGVDINHQNIHPKVRNKSNIHLITGDAVSVRKEFDWISSKDKVIVIEDSAHTYNNTLNVLNTYYDLVPKGGWFIVEDTICNRQLTFHQSLNPYGAVQKFRESHPDFVPDKTREIFELTWNEEGYLHRC